ncbi:MAG: LacI family transcriptional regulator [Lentisphaerae bacterium]|nr:LacI family transcriptional regulator [Lentisphaerota bacterium]
MKKRITVKDIAERAGVNYATVSRALNPATASMISEKVRANIQRIADELGYRPSYSGKSIVTGKTYKIGMILGRMKQDFAAHDWARIMCGLTAEIQKHGYVLTLLYANGSETMDTQVLNFLMSGVADGYVTGPSMVKGKVTEMLDKLKVPLWVVSESGQTVENVNHIQRDDMDSFCEVWKNIPKRCLKKMLYFSEFSNEKQLRLQEVERAGQIVYPDGRYCLKGMFYHRNMSSTVSQYRLAMNHALKNLDELKKYKFIWCDADTSALAVYDVLTNAGIKVGKDIFLVGYGDLETYDERFAVPILSTISAGAEQIGMTMGKALMNQISGGKEKQFIAKTTLIARETFPVK